MRLVYSDPLDELKALIVKAEQSDNVSHIALTSSELRACLDHADAAEVFPRLMNERTRQLVHVREQMKKIRPLINGNTLSYREKQPMFDRMDLLQAEENKILSKLPKTIREGNVVFRVSMH